MAHLLITETNSNFGLLIQKTLDEELMVFISHNNNKKEIIH